MGKHRLTCEHSAPICSECRLARVREQRARAERRRYQKIMADPELRKRKCLQSTEYHKRKLDEDPDYWKKRYERLLQAPDAREKKQAANRRYSEGVKNPEVFNRLFELQGRKCAICESTEPRTKNGWCLDHDHATGLSRGVLCAHCNRGLGGFSDALDLVRRAAQYLESPPAKSLE